MIDGQGMKLIEPLRELFKDEVRQLGRELGIAHELVMRVRFDLCDLLESLYVDTNKLEAPLPWTRNCYPVG